MWKKRKVYGATDQLALDEAMFECWLHMNWHFVTRKMSMPAKEAALAAIIRHHDLIDNEEPFNEGMWAWWRS